MSEPTTVTTQRRTGRCPRCIYADARAYVRGDDVACECGRVYPGRPRREGRGEREGRDG